MPTGTVGIFFRSDNHSRQCCWQDTHDAARQTPANASRPETLAQAPTVSTKQSRMSAASKDSIRYLRIWKTVARIPRGKVATYGQIARLCGLAGQARLVGYALHSLPSGIDIPWHRVVNAQGRISFPAGSTAYFRQKEMLEIEGIVFVKDRIDLKTHGWRPKQR